MALGSGEVLWDFFFHQGSWEEVIVIGFWGSIYLFFFYGLFIWPPVLVFMFLVELIFSKKNLKAKEIRLFFGIEWGIISAPFVFWAITEDYPSWYWHIFILGVSQFFRLKFLTKHQYDDTTIINK